VTDAATLIRAKRDGRRLADDDIRWLFEAYAAGEVADEQMSALLMAIFFRGLDGAELRTWTAAMIASGDRLDLSCIARPTVDKHSTGGVGDKVSLILAPLVASCGAAVPQLSGRGLGHTGGTLDKLESIPGFRAGLSPAEMLAVLASAGCVICAAGSGLAPADRRLYALRDVTGTVESIPLIASSIMSKKIAEGTGALVLDVKVGTGAFMKSREAARELAETMVALGAEHQVRTSALLTAMDVPLGRAVGNAVEVEESVAALHGNGPADLMEVTFALARQMLALAGLDADPAAAIADGRALAAYRDATLFKVIYGWGLRRTETSRLDVADWGRNPAAPEFGRHGMLHVRYGKAKRGQPPRRRNVASMMGWAVEAVADYVENIRPKFGCDGHPALWVTERGGRVRPPEINARFEAYRDALGLPAALVVHSLRHSYVICTASDPVRDVSSAA